MPHRPVLLILFLFSAVRAQAVECRAGMFTPAALAMPCGSKNLEGQARCQTYQADFMEACEKKLINNRVIVLALENTAMLIANREIEHKNALDRYNAAAAAMKEAGQAYRPGENSEAYARAPAFIETQGIPANSLRNNADRVISGANNRAEIKLSEMRGPTLNWSDNMSKGTTFLALLAETKAPPKPDTGTSNDPPGTETKDIPRSSSQILDQVKSADPQEGAEIIATAGEQALAAGRTDDAEQLGEALVKSAPSDSRGPALIAEAALSERRPADAERWAQRALILDPKDKKAQATLSLARSDLSAQTLKKPVVGSFQEARTQDLAQGLAAGALPPRPAGPAGPPAADAPAKDAEPVRRVLAGLLRRGYEKMNMGDLPGALEDVSVHIDSHPEDTGARLVRAEILLKLGKPVLALADIDAALVKSPDDPRALRARAAALYEIGGRDEEALTTIERALTIEPASGIGHLTRAKILERLNRTQEAIAEYKTAAQLDPTLEPVVEAALRRLGAASPAPKGVERKLLRGGLIVVSLGLILLGLVGAAVVATRRARTAEAAAAASERTLKTGDLIAGQYRITRELGRGGMGVVFEAVDEKLKRSVALKQLQGEFRASAEDAARFLQEARLVAQLRHPNVAEIYAAVEDGGLYLVFELVRGRSLDAVLGAGVSPEQARGIVAHACAALTAAHARRIVHRDLKPSNLMISDAGEVKVMDFGIAHQSVHGGAFTQTSASGTPPYMAPEQAMGSVSAASDLYAMGVMAYELLAGVRPFEGPDFLGPKMRGEFAPVTSRRAALPARLDAFFLSALSPDPARRPSDAAAFAAAFAACWS